MSKNASDEIESPPKKKAKKSIKFGGWFPDCLDWFKRPELAQSSLSTSSSIFNQYCWPKLHGRKVKPHTVPRLIFTREKDNEGGNERSILKIGQHSLFPIAKINLPEYITGFGEITFEFVDDEILQFVQKIVPLLEDRITIHFNFQANRCHQGFKDPFINLMEMLAPKTNKLEIYDSDFDLIKFHQRIPNFIFGLQSILITNFTNNLMDLFVEWLNVSTEDEKPKMLSIGFAHRGHSVDEFFKWAEPVNYIIQLYYYDEPISAEELDEEEIFTEQIEEEEIFKIENEMTGEILNLYNKPIEFEHILIRYKKDGEKTPKNEWMEELKREEIPTIWIGG